MTLLLIGSGFVGERAADLLQASGHTVIGTAHSEASTERLRREKTWRVECCDVSSAASVQQLATRLQDSGMVVDAFIHCASSSRGGAEMYQSVYVDGMQHLRRSFPAAFACYTGSTSVYPQCAGETVDETSPAEPERETGRLLREAENIALEAGGCVARLAGIYGPGRSFLLKNLLEGQAAIEGNSGQGRYLNQIHAHDAASALVHLITQRLSGLFNVVDDQRLTQKEAYLPLCKLFALHLPPEKEPDANRKRGWSHKHVSNAKLRATGWSPRYPTYLDAVLHDPDLASSILELVQNGGGASTPRQPNILLIGLMGSGKTTVGRHVAQMTGFQFLDTDHLLIEQAGQPIPAIFAAEGESGFRLRESATLRGLLGRRGCVIATGGGIITQPRNLPLLRHLGYIVWLDAEPALLARRTSFSQDRPLLAGEEDPQAKLERLLTERKPLYKALADLRIQTAGLAPQESAYGITESARLFFAGMKR
jgi:shikimate kinase/nucleoside-diphosphate-sugar epimerase